MTQADTPLAWQAAQWQRWQRSISAGRRPHALLLAGCDGIGKRHFANYLIAGLLCESPQSAAPCGSCHGCEVRRGGAHPALRLLQPPEGKRQIPVDEVRAAIDMFSRSAMLGDTKVCLIEPAEALGVASCNALLKTLEEPPGDAVIILLSASPSALLPTIRSRCQQLKFHVPEVAAARDWLRAVSDADDTAIDAALTEAGGRPLLAAEYLSAGIVELRKSWDADWEQLSAARLTVPVLAEQWAKLDFLPLLDWLCARLASCVRSQALGGAMPPSWTALQNYSPRVLHEIHRDLQQLNWQSQSFANANKRLQLEAVLFRLTGKQSILRT